jgi:phosphoserine aminotransferase
LVIIRKDLAGKAMPHTPMGLDYQAQIEADSCYNTPPSFAIYVAGLVFAWILEQGGMDEMARKNTRKAQMLYDYIDASGFYSNPVEKSCRSRMNVPFRLQDERLNDAFLQQARERELLELKGHRAVGAMRASIYNAMPEEGVATLIDFMKEFVKHHG